MKATDSWNVLVGRNLSVSHPPHLPILYYKQTSCIIYKAPRMKMQGKTLYLKIKNFRKARQSMKPPVGSFLAWGPVRLCRSHTHEASPEYELGSRAHSRSKLSSNRLLYSSCWLLWSPLVTKKVGPRERRGKPLQKSPHALLW